MTWVAVCAPGARVLLRVLAEDLGDVLAGYRANDRALLSSAWRWNLGLIFHVAIKGPPD